MTFLLMMFSIAVVFLFALVMYWFAIPAFGRWLVARYAGKDVER